MSSSLDEGEICDHHLLCRWNESKGTAKISINPPAGAGSRFLSGTYLPQAIRGVEIPKSNGKKRLLGIPTVVDRWLQQAVNQQLMTRFELGFSDYSYGFRPKKNMQQALLQSLSYINAGYSDIVDIDLGKFFDEVSHKKILQLIYEKVNARQSYD